MGVIARDENQITLIYSSESAIGKETRGYLRDSRIKSNEVDIAKDNVTGTEWAEIADAMGVQIGDLLTKEHPDVKNIKDVDLDQNGWIKMLDKNPEYLQKPILIKGETIVQLEQTTDILQYLEVDSEGIHKEPLHVLPPTEGDQADVGFTEREGYN